MHDENCFITLTYNDDHHRDSLDKETRKEFQDFMKRLRWKFGKVRYYMCGEYGETNGRPHFHACLFGMQFRDLVLLKERNGVRLYTSDTLSSLWPFGFSTVGDVTKDSAAYVAGYIQKKITGDAAKEHYTRINVLGEMVEVEPEYSRMPLKPGIGLRFYEKFKGDLYPHDYAIVEGKRTAIPRYYDKQLPESELEELKYKRAKKRRKKDRSEARNEAGELIAKARLSLKNRTL